MTFPRGYNRDVECHDHRLAVHANQDCFCLGFADEGTGTGVHIVVSHQSFREYMLTLAKARETIEAKQEEE